jgi:hypothetical protein
LLSNCSYEEIRNKYRNDRHTISKACLGSSWKNITGIDRELIKLFYKKISVSFRLKLSEEKLNKIEECIKTNQEIPYKKLGIRKNVVDKIINKSHPLQQAIKNISMYLIENNKNVPEEIERIKNLQNKIIADQNL